MTVDNTCQKSTLAIGASAALAMVVAIGVWPAGCASSPRVLELEPLRVERQWRRSVGAPQVELPSPRIAASDGGVIMSFQPSGTIERSTITREFLVTPSATLQSDRNRSAALANLDALALEAIRDEYPALASNAEAVIGPSQVHVGQYMLATGSGRSLADLQLSIEPEPARIGEARPVGISAENVEIVSARLVLRGDPLVTLLEGRRIDSKRDQFEFNVASLAGGDCRRLRSLLLGDYEVLAECEVRTGATEVVRELRRFGPSSERAWQDPISRSAGQQLESIAATDPAMALSMEVARERSFARRGELLPGVLVVNVSDRPVLDLRTFTVAYQIRQGDALTYVGSSVADGDPCLCPGEALEIPGVDLLDACGEALHQAGDGLLAAVSTSAIDSRTIGPIPVEAVTRFGAGLLPPRVEGAEVLLEATAASAVPKGAVEVRLLFGEAGEIRTAFPAIPEGGAGVLRLPADLDADAAAVWDEWRAAGGRVDVELLEASLWECENASPARQAFRIGR